MEYLDWPQIGLSIAPANSCAIPVSAFIRHWPFPLRSLRSLMLNAPSPLTNERIRALLFKVQRFDGSKFKVLTSTSPLSAFRLPLFPLNSPRLSCAAHWLSWLCYTPPDFWSRNTSPNLPCSICSLPALASQCSRSPGPAPASGFLFPCSSRSAGQTWSPTPPSFPRTTSAHSCQRVPPIPPCAANFSRLRP